MAKKFLGIGFGTIALVGGAILVWQSCKLAVTHKQLAPICTFSNQIRNTIQGLKMPPGGPGMTPGMLNNPVVNKSCVCMGGKFVGTCDTAGQPCMNSPAKKTPAKKSMLGYTMSRMAGAFDDDIL
jgi:hypothetical protein